jgi:ribosomal RNA-processing protein 1
VPDGIRYHVLDVWVDELDEAFSGGGEEAEALEREGGEESREKRKKAVVEIVMVLVERMAKEAMTKGVRVRAREVLADEHFKKSW